MKNQFIYISLDKYDEVSLKKICSVYHYILEQTHDNTWSIEGAFDSREKVESLINPALKVPRRKKPKKVHHEMTNGSSVWNSV